MAKTVVTALGVGKSGMQEYHIALLCPWCGVVSSTTTNLVHRASDGFYLFARCEVAGCYRGVMGVINTPVPVLSAGHNYVPAIYPTSQVAYAPAGVPTEIARDFQEALACFAAGHNFGAALVARRVLQATARGNGGTGRDLKAEIDSIPGTKLTEVLRDAAHEVRYVGNDAAHANAVDPADVDALLAFTGELLEALYVLPEKVKAMKAKRTGTPPAGTPPTTGS